MKHVVHLLHGLGAGGNETTCLALIQRAPAGVRTTVVLLNAEPRALESEFLALPNTTLLQAPLGASRRRLLSWWMGELRRLKPDAVLSHGFGIDYMLMAAVARTRASRPIAMKVGNPVSSHGRWKIRVLVGAARLLRVPLCSCSTSVEASLRDLGVGLPRRSTPIQNGCSVEVLHRLALEQRKRRAPSDPLVIGMVARLDSIKDHDTLLRAFADIRARPGLPDAELWLVGDGAERPKLEHLAETLGISAKVRFCGVRSDIPQLLGQMDIFAFSTTRDEGFGIALIEAMSAELPVTATEVPACREVLGGGEAGILVPPGDKLRLADRLEELLTSRDVREEWGRRAHARVKREYDIDACARRWYEMLGS